MKLSNRHKLYSNLGIQLLGSAWVSISFVTSLPIGISATLLLFNFLDIQSRGYAVLSILAFTIMIVHLLGLPFWGWQKYLQLKKKYGSSEAHRFVRWLEKGDDPSFDFK
ncbi:hypothetical protein [Vibrio vulnificus]|uniref:Uncharacterized protein n=1 Tax=Vibrio vulnificus TaxID=672 RepID=A0A2S3R252_VIBVL|nr:hypothetical protein [Vibrio vulnificus]POB47181.1 hypothetical protein CRN52_13965 [Vibrio vulnificus]